MFVLIGNRRVTLCSGKLCQSTAKVEAVALAVVVKVEVEAVAITGVVLLFWPGRR